MAYKTPEQMLNYIRENNLLTDACMTIIDGRNEFGFHAIEIPKESVKDLGNGNFQIVLVDGDNDVHIPVKAADPKKETSFWLISFKEGRYDIICVQHEKNAGSAAEVKQKEYMSVIALFLDHYKIGTASKLMEVLKYGYNKLKEETDDKDNAYELLRDYMDAGLVVKRAEHIPDKFGVRFKFHLEDEQKN